MERDWRLVGLICEGIKPVLGDRVVDELEAEHSKPVILDPDAHTTGSSNYSIPIQDVLPENFNKKLDTEWVRMQILQGMHELVNNVHAEGNKAFSATIKHVDEDWVIITNDTKLLHERFDEVQEVARRKAKESLAKRSDMPIWPL